MKQHMRLAVVVAPILTLSVLACQMNGIALGRTTPPRGSGNVTEEIRAVSGFSAVELATLGTLHIEVGDKQELRIEADDNLIGYFETAVRNGRLTIETQKGVDLRTTEPVNYYLTATDLDTIVISSSGNVEAPDLATDWFSVVSNSSGDLEMGDLAVDTLVVDISSSGDIRIGVLHANVLEVDINSSGNLDIVAGEVERQELTISSSGDYTAEGLESVEAEVRLSSNGSATIGVRDYLRANLSSSGDLRYIGNPTVDAMTSASGDVVWLGE